MFYNAMKRKGYEPVEGDMSTIVGMHNAVNETVSRLSHHSLIQLCASSLLPRHPTMVGNQCVRLQVDMRMWENCLSQNKWVVLTRRSLVWQCRDSPGVLFPLILDMVC